MITVCEKGKCTGCMACVDICPRKAISVVDDIEYMNAVIDDTLCINCNMCHKVCQRIIQQIYESRKNGFRAGEKRM